MKIIWFTTILLLTGNLVVAQHDMKNMKGMQHSHHTDSAQNTHKIPDMGNAHKEMDTSMANMAHEHMKMDMSHAFSLNLPMNRNGSGTAWLPDNSPMYGYMVHSNEWMFMFHGNVFIRYNSQDFTNKGTRGGEKVDAPNMLMAMGQRKIGQRGLFHFNTMLSLDAAFAGGSGYPLLFQTGESWKGKPLVDRQHPHDLFSELSVSYSYAFSKQADAFIYLGYPGEPALGPVTFMHRPSGMFNPDAPIGHHWEDATHIAFGVATIGLRYGSFKLEGSSFTGREPDEDRYNFDKPMFDSWSGRLSFNPSRNWALQISNGFIKSPEALRPLEGVSRTTASATCSYPIGKNSFFDATALYGRNKEINHDESSNTVLLEATAHFQKLVIYSRYDWIKKSTEELNLDVPTFGNHTLFPINAFTLGLGYDLVRIGVIKIAAGGQLSFYHADDRLNTLYGTNPLAGEVYLHLYPKLMK